MFFTKLYNHSKALFLIVVLFLIAFVFLNIKWGAVASPIYQYGMFSGKVRMSDTQKVYRIYVNDRLLNLTQYSVSDRDKLLSFLDQYKYEKQKNAATFTTMRRLLLHTGIGNIMHEKIYTNNISDVQFTVWYKSMLQQIVGYRVTKLAVYTQLFKWESVTLKPIGSPEKETFIVTD